MLEYGLRIDLYSWRYFLLVFVAKEVVDRLGGVRHHVVLLDWGRVVEHRMGVVVVIPEVFDFLSDA